MKKLVLLVVAAFMVSSLAGCSKKKKDDLSSMEGLNGVTSENVVSVMDNTTVGGGVTAEVPVIVDNAAGAGNETYSDMTQVASEVVDAAASKPQPKQIQQALKNAGFYTGKVDGDIGPRTKKSIEAFQAQHGLKADGKVGAKTWKALAAYLNKSTEVANPTEDVQAVGQ